MADPFKADNVREAIIEPMKAIWSKPRNVSDEIKFLELFYDHLGDFDRATLEAAWNELVRKRTYSTWPQVGEVVTICERLAPPKVGGDKDQAAHWRRAEAYTTDWLNRHNDAFCQALRGGYGQQLREFVNKEALAQMRHGAEKPDVPVPDNSITEWEAEADEIRKRGPVDTRTVKGSFRGAAYAARKALGNRKSLEPDPKRERAKVEAEMRMEAADAFELQD